LSKFGEEGNLIVVGVKDDFFKKLCCLDQINERVKSAKESRPYLLNDLKLEKNDSLQKFELVPFVDQSKTGSQAYLDT
jgi:hypothetical protein